jgi:hypothetical protein
MAFINDFFHRWRKDHIWPTLWVLTVLIICRGLLSQRAPLPVLEENPSNSSHPENTKYYSTHSAAIDASSPSLNPHVFLNVSTSPKVAVIIETRAPGYLVPLILHFSAVLGNTWPIIIYTEAENFGRFSTSSALHRLQVNGRVNIRSLPEGLYFPSWGSVSNFLTDPWLWNDLAPAEHIFMFQADSIVCSNSARSVDDYLEYDMIGAPIIERFGKGYNGGLSLRKRSTFLRIIEEFPYGPKSRPHPEDQWFFARYVNIQNFAGTSS